MQKTLGFSLLLLLSGSLFADNWKHSLSLGLNLTKGNSDTEQINTDYKGNINWEKAKASIGLNANFSEENNQKTTENYASFGQFNRYISDRSYWLINGNYEIDKQANLDNRILLGPGFGFSFIKTKTSNLDFEGGLAWQSTKYTGLSEESNTAIRIAESFKTDLSTHAKLWQSIEYLGNAESSSSYIFNGILGIESSVTGALSIKSFINHSYNNSPATGKKKGDTAFTTMLVYSF